MGSCGLTSCANITSSPPIYIFLPYLGNRYAVHENVVFHVVERSRLVAGLVQLLVGCFCAEWQMYEPSLDSFKSIACRHFLRYRPGFQHCLEALDSPTEHHLDRVQLLQLVRTLAGEHIVEQRNTRSFILVQLPLTVCAYQFAVQRVFVVDHRLVTVVSVMLLIDTSTLKCSHSVHHTYQCFYFLSSSTHGPFANIIL